MSEKKKSKKIRKDKMHMGDMGIKYAREAAMPTIFEAFVELITNSDDAYENMNKDLNYQGDLRIEFKRGGKKEPTSITFKDRASGMTYEEMRKNLFDHSKRVSESSRGFFGRGLKDVTALGDVTVKAIKDDKYSEVILHHNLQISTIEENIQAKKIHRQDIGTKKSGMSVNVLVEPGSKSEYNPYSSTIIKDLPQHYALSKILHEKNKTLNVTFVDQNDRGKETKLIYREPVAELVHEEKIPFPKINKEAKFKLFRLEELVENQNSGFARVTGISVFGKKACFQKNFLDNQLETDPLAHRYYGYLECDHIDFLMDEWQRNASADKKHHPDNAIFILDATRLKGLSLKHPFTKELFKRPVQIIKDFIQKDKKSKAGNELTDHKLKKLLNDMMQDCSDLLNDIDREEIGGEDRGDLSSTEWRAIPSNIKLLPEEEKNISIYTYENNISKDRNVELYIDSKDKSFIEVQNNISKLEQTNNDPKKYRAQFKIKGILPKDKIKLIFRSNNQIKTQVTAEVYVNKHREFKNDIEFEHQNYNVILNGSRNLKVFAKVPEVINEDNFEADIIVSDNQSISSQKKCQFKIIDQTNYAVGLIKVKGLKLGSKTKLDVKSTFATGSTNIGVLSKEEDNKNPFTWDIGPYNLGNNRAVWDTTNSNVLKISSKHPTVKKYLGSDVQPFPYSESVLFRLLLVEIFAEKFAEKRVSLIASNNPIEYSDLTRYSEVNDIMQQAMFYYEKAKVSFVNKLHSRLKDEEIKLLNK